MKNVFISELKEKPICYLKGHLELNLDSGLDTDERPRDWKFCSLYQGFVVSKFFFMYFTVTGMTKSIRYSVSIRTSLYRGSVISRFHCKNAVNLWRIGTDCILCHSQIR